MATELASGKTRTRTPGEVAEAFVSAIAARDFDGARRCLSDGRFSARSPISTFDNADAFIENISRVGSILEDVKQRKRFVDGNDVCLVVDYITHMGRRQVSHVVHLMRIENLKIVHVESFFDARAYAEMFDVD